MAISIIKLRNAASGRAPYAPVPLVERRAIRLEAGVSRVALAEAVGVAGMTIYRWEEGRATPSNSVLADRYGRALAYLQHANIRSETR